MDTTTANGIAESTAETIRRAIEVLKATLRDAGLNDDIVVVSRGQFEALLNEKAKGR